MRASCDVIGGEEEAEEASAAAAAQASEEVVKECDALFRLKEEALDTMCAVVEVDVDPTKEKVSRGEEEVKAAAEAAAAVLLRRWRAAMKWAPDEGVDPTARFNDRGASAGWRRRSRDGSTRMGSNEATDMSGADAV